MLAQGQVSLTAVKVIDECAHEIQWFLKLAGLLLLAAYPKDLEPKRLGMPHHHFQWVGKVGPSKILSVFWLKGVLITCFRLKSWSTSIGPGSV